MALTDSLISWWKLDEASGNAIDSHGSHDMTPAGGSVGAATGKVNGARSFASGSHLLTAQHADFNVADTDLTVCAWLKRSVGEITVGNVLGSHPIASNYWFVYAQQSPVVYQSFIGGNYTATATGNALGQWDFIVFWHDKTTNTVNLQVNNGAVAVTPHSTGFGAGSSDGFYIAYGNWLTGLVDECGYWKRVLTADERTYLYNGGAGRTYDDIAPPVITTTSLPNGVPGDDYNQTLTATGGAGTKSWAVTGGALPTGLSLSSAGIISGSVSAAIGVYSFTVTVTDSNGSDTQALTITVTAYTGTPRFPSPNITGILWEHFNALPTDFAPVTISHTYEDEGRSFNETTTTPAKRWEVVFSGLSFDEMQIFETFANSVRLTQTFTFRDKWGVTHSGVRVELYERSHNANISWSHNVRFILVKYP